MKKLKPEGIELIEWCNKWDLSDHAGKIELCRSIGVSYETGRHIRSDSGIPKIERPKPVEPEVVEEEPEEPGTNIGGFLLPEPRIALDFVTFDIETTNLTADFSVMLCACIKPFGEKPMVFRVDDYNKEWATRRRDDKGLVEAVSKELMKHAIIVTHYGSRFDIPYLRAKMVKYGLAPLPPMFGIDTYSIAKANFKVSSRREKALCNYFELGKKTDVEGGLWVEAGMNGSKEALDLIVEHNVQDCVLLEKLASVSYPYLKSIRKM